MCVCVFLLILADVKTVSSSAPGQSPDGKRKTDGSREESLLSSPISHGRLAAAAPLFFPRPGAIGGMPTQRISPPAREKPLIRDEARLLVPDPRVKAGETVLISSEDLCSRGVPQGGWN